MVATASGAKRSRTCLCCLAIIGLVAAASLATSAEVEWFSIDGGGGISTLDDIELVGVAAQSDTTRMRAGDVNLSGGYLPLPPAPEIVFKDGYEQQ